MHEVMFVFKSFIVAIIVMIGLQVKIGKSSLEQRAEHWIQTSSVASYVQNVSSGAVLAIRNAAGVATDFVMETFGNESTAQKAGRLNLNFKRSESFQKEQVEKDSEEDSRY